MTLGTRLLSWVNGSVGIWQASSTLALSGWVGLQTSLSKRGRSSPKTIGRHLFGERLDLGRAKEEKKRGGKCDPERTGCLLRITEGSPMLEMA